MELKLYNTITRKKEDFKALDDSHVRVYACGPTVYDKIHIVGLQEEKNQFQIGIELKLQHISTQIFYPFQIAFEVVLENIERLILGPWHCLKLKVQEIHRLNPEFSHSLT